METLMWKQAVQAAQGAASSYSRSSMKGLFGGFGSVVGGMTMGGVGGYWGGDGTAGDFIGGALMGGLGGAALSGMAARKSFTRASAFARQKLGGTIGRQGYRAATALQSQAGRSALFGSGAFLTGTAFGAMFGHPRANRKRGFNQHRGNRF